jgi:putative DNA primase/helicase
MSTVTRFDDAIAHVREELKKSAQQEGETLVEEEPWPDPVPDIGEVMEEAATELRRYVVMDEPSLHTAIVWSVFAHLLHYDHLKINIAPRFAIQSSDPDMGKTTLLEGLACLTPRPNMVGSTTASSIFRTIDGRRPTYLIDEIDNLLHHSADPILKAILNSGHRKRSAYAERSEKQPDGSFKVLLLSTWAAIATAGIGELYPPLQSRSIINTLSKATGSEQPEHMIDGESEVLFRCRRKFARWAQDLPALPAIDRPKELLNRKGDNWYPLRQIAELAGGKWPECIRAAATRATARPNDPKGGVALLEDLWTVFYQAGLPRLRTEEIIAKLIALEESPWREANHGKAITSYYLREAFKPYFKVWEDNNELHKARNWKEQGRTVTGYRLASASPKTDADQEQAG